MSWLNAGSLAATNGNANFVGTGTLLLGAFAGDALVYQTGTTFWASEIASITDNTHAATVDNWSFSSGTIANGNWSVLPCSPLRQTVATTNAQIATIISQFSSVLSLSASDNTATFNKAAASNSAGMYLTTGGAARGRVGTFGDDNLRLSVANGGGYTDALVASYTTGLVTVAGDPAAALGIATKQYVDGSSNAKVVRAASTANINIASPGTAIGGVTPANGERYLLAGQTTASQNGIYIYNGASSAMTRATDADIATELLPGCLVVASEGTNANRPYILATAAPLVIGTTNLTFSRLDGLYLASPTITGTVSAGAATFSSTLTAQALVDISGAGAGQIKFPGAQHASSDANTLDDYEEGTWTPTDVSGASLSLTITSATYVKVGQSVIVTARFQYPSTGNGNNADVSGLPFASKDYATAISYAFNTVILVSPSGTDFVFHNSAGNTMTNANLNTSSIIFSLGYRANA